MDTTCAIVIASFVGGACVLGGCICYCTSQRPSTQVAPNAVVISREQYETLLKIAKDLPVYGENDPPGYTEPVVETVGVRETPQRPLGPDE